MINKLKEIILEKRIEANTRLESKDSRDKMFGYGMVNVINAVHTYVHQQESISVPVIIEADIIAEAKKYAGFKENINPNNSDERYYQLHKCELYDAFIAGYNYKINKL